MFENINKYSELWFDVERRYKTIGYVPRYAEYSCGLM